MGHLKLRWAMLTTNLHAAGESQDRPLLDLLCSMENNPNTTSWGKLLCWDKSSRSTTSAPSRQPRPRTRWSSASSELGSDCPARGCRTESCAEASPAAHSVAGDGGLVALRRRTRLRRRPALTVASVGPATRGAGRRPGGAATPPPARPSPTSCPRQRSCLCRLLPRSHGLGPVPETLHKLLHRGRGHPDRPA